MSSKISEDTVARLVAQFQTVLRQPILKVTRPGGEDRPIYRVYLADRTVIVAQRDDTNAAGKERALLDLLAPHTDRVPRVLGFHDGLTYLTDCGTERLGIALYRADAEARLPLVLDAIDAMGDMHRAACPLDWTGTLNAIGVDQAWIRHFARGPERLARMLGLPEPICDIDALQSELTVDTPRFVKWDSRLANATLDPQGHVHWIDFEHSGLRHGAEDYAWMLCDEVFPLRLRDCYAPIRARIAKVHPKGPQDPVRMAEIFGALQASLRLRVIVNELAKKSWTPQRDILAWDLVGADAYMAQRLAENGSFLADLHGVTRPMGPLLRQIAEKFRAARDTPNPIP